ncbi:MAG: adenylosuccinate synthase [Bacteroidales bacterium]|jgi:adenylosuccinate synthase|nr:adenylosuccinate synthase [Bacteroidales bacterium]MDI9593511.1 adenylosuccinate synthase [Bacteroidota bacterium]NLH34094.1 adenylosuccinate synthase [Lentimicrobium sp.]OQC37397.1 MAG: Adenylosuccinate synthetase [Bacteroidetes bacterium ADurb.Bin041]MBP7874467.1 adenylosuccinate synthase [Bacteroidales bacterium]
MKVDVLLGLQWGDEGKGKIVDVLTPEYDVIARFQGGPNAGHTIKFEGLKFVLHTIPSGIFNPNKTNVIGNGVILDPVIFRKEINQLIKTGVNPKDNLLISRKAHLILPGHRLLDAVYEKAKGRTMIGSTLKGIGPTYTDKVARQGLRIGDIEKQFFLEKYNHLKELQQRIVNTYKVNISNFEIDGLSFNEYEKLWFDSLEILKQFQAIDSEYFINQAIDNNKKVLAEGAQGTMLDIDFGSYPFVTSSNTVSAGVCSGLGVAPSKIGKVFGVFKAYCTRVGNGPFPTELNDETGQMIRETGNEYGATTGRPRRCGWLDLTALKYSIMLNGVTDLIMTKGDVLTGFEKIKVSNGYLSGNQKINHVPYDIEPVLPIYEEIDGWQSPVETIATYDELPDALKDYVNIIEKRTKTPISIISVGPDRSQTIIRS